MPITKINNPHYSTSPKWIKNCFEFLSKELTGVTELARDSGVRDDADAPEWTASWILALLMHGSHCADTFVENHARLISTTTKKGLFEHLHEISEARKPADMLRAAKPLSGLQGSVRRSTSRIVTRSFYSTNFLPPKAERIPGSLSVIFDLRSRLLHFNDVTGPSLATYLTFLTVHPLVDGNGRTARLLFAADVLSKNRRNHFLVLALLFMHSNRSQLFHLSARCARDGGFEMIASCFTSSLKMITGDVLSCLSSLAGAKSRGEAAEINFAIDLHCAVRSIMSPTASTPRIFI